MNGTNRLVIMGGGGHAAVVAEAARASGWTIDGYLDDAPETEPPAAVVNLRRLGAIADLLSILNADTGKGYPAIHAAVGEADLRRRWLEFALDLPGTPEAPPVFHPSAVISPSATLGRGVFIGPQAVVNPRACIGDGVIINSGAIVEHDCNIGPWSHLAPRSAIGGGVTVGESVLIGIGSTVRPEISIAERVIVGAGAAVVANVPEGVTVAGVPAAALGTPASSIGS